MCFGPDGRPAPRAAVSLYDSERPEQRPDRGAFAGRLTLQSPLRPVYPQPDGLSKRGEFHPRLAFAHLADDKRRHPFLFQLPLDALRVVTAHDYHEADAAVEDVVHLGLLDVAQFLQPIDDRRHRPTAAQNYLAPRRQDARHVVYQAAAGDMGQAAHHALLNRVMTK